MSSSVLTHVLHLLGGTLPAFAAKPALFTSMIGFMAMSLWAIDAED